MRLLTYSRYGTRMMLDIAMHGRKGPVQMSDIARRQGISQKYLEKIIRILKGAGIITSVRGPKGGHLLSRPAEQISIGDIVRALEGDAVLVDCLMDDDSCSQAPGCLTRMIWREGSRAMFKRFDEIVLTDLIEQMEQGIRFGETCPTVEALREQKETDKPASRAARFPEGLEIEAAGASEKKNKRRVSCGEPRGSGCGVGRGCPSRAETAEIAGVHVETSRV